MNTEPFAQFLADRELVAELVAARNRIAELEHTVEVLETCIANYHDAFSVLGATS